jgi:hypothetical protein
VTVLRRVVLLLFPSAFPSQSCEEDRVVRAQLFTGGRECHEG